MQTNCFLLDQLSIRKGSSGGSAVRNLPANGGDVGSVSALGRSPGEENGKPLQYSCLESSMERIPFLPREFSPEEPGRLQSMGLQRVRHY